MSQYRSSRFLIPFILGSIGFLTVLFSEYIVIDQGEKIVEVSWLASLFVVLSTLIIRFYSLDSKRVNQIMIESNPLKAYELNPTRYLNWMVVSMLVGLIATITIHSNFIYGMLVYLLMQFCLIVAFSGIITVNPLKYRINPGAFRKIVIALFLWVILIPTIYLVLVYSDVDSLIVVPYVVAIGIMACISWFGLIYNRRSGLFRWLMIIATGLFVFSDTLIGNDQYGTSKINLGYLIDVTYVLNIFLLSNAVLFLRSKLGMTPFKN